MDALSIAQQGRAESIKVLVRVRPLSGTELSDGNDSVVDIQSEQSLAVTSADGKKSFKCSFDSVLGPTSSQMQVYEVIRGCTESVIEGFNSTIFAYGQTGSGKTFSMYGPPSSTGPSKGVSRDPGEMGLIPRAIEEIFELVQRREIAEFQVHCSFVQIYNENLYDMLRDASMNTPLSIREDNKEIYVQGLSEYNVKSVADTLQLLRIAEENRAIRETNMNMSSSRSHSIFQIQLEQKRVGDDGGEVTLRAKFNLVDLAGSEKWNTRLQLRDEHIAEMTNINLSLHTLGKCISALAQASLKQQQRDSGADSRVQTATTAQRDRDREKEREKDRERERLSSGDWDARSSLGSLEHSGSTIGSIKDFPVPNKSSRPSQSSSGNTSSRDLGTHIPFRESKLTRLLQDSLGGNARTFLIATVSPARSNSEETISTLKFADRAKQVMVQAVVNESRPVDYALVKRLQQEVEMLKGLLKRMVQAQNPNSSSGGGGAISVNAAIFSAKLKQASSAAEIGELLNSGSVGGVGGGGPGSSASSPSRSYSPEPLRMGAGNGGGCTSPPTKQGYGQGQGGAAEGSSLEYVMSLEKALNQEQIHSQHLGKKNETLIKELEELKFQNMQLQQQSGQYGTRGPTSGANSGGVGGCTTPAPLTKQISINSLAITAAQVTQVIDSVQGLLRENARLVEQVDQVQKVMKRFFKFQIEEEDMKKSLESVFAAVKDIKVNAASVHVVDNFAFLEFLATNVGIAKGSAPSSSTSSPARGGISPNEAGDAHVTTTAAMVAVGSSGGAGRGHGHLSKKQLRRLADQQQLPALDHAAVPLSSASFAAKAGVTVAGVPMRENTKASAYVAQQELAQQRNLPALASGSAAPAQHRYSAAADESSRTAQRGRDLHSAGSDDGAAQIYDDGPYLADTSYAHSMDAQDSSHPPGHRYQQPHEQSHHSSRHAHDSHHPPGHRYQQQHEQSHISSRHAGGQQPSSLGAPQLSGAPALTYRVRGGPGHQAQGQSALSASSVTSLGSSGGGWVVPAEEEAAAAEAALKAELKQAKKKLKKQQQMAEWQRIKEEKQRAEAEAEEAQRAAEAEAEAQREQKRKEYAQKQKQKLAQYQTKVKSEAEKIQELKNLGIDPSSLF